VRPKTPITEAPEDVRTRAPLNSVSNRIILCVFVSTLLTALIVSWLSVGAIHDDVRSRIAHRGSLLLDDQVESVAEWHRQATAQLAASSAIGSNWHGDLLDALENSQDGGPWVWQSPELGPAAFKTPGVPLPIPPAELTVAYDRLALHHGHQPISTPLDCLSVGIDVVRQNSHVEGRLDGCIATAPIYEVLMPATREVRGMRILISDGRGKVIAATGVRGESRLGAALPLAELMDPSDGQLANYADEGGARLVGALRPIGPTGWYLVAEAEHARAFAPAIAITNQIFVVDVCIILLFSVLAYKITQAIMQPIDALSRGARRIAEGHVDYEIPMPANNEDELGLLTQAFNGMMRKLRSSQNEIVQDHMRLAEKNEELQRANEILAQLSITDGLTKLHNHRYFQDHLTREIKRVSRTEAPLALILLDIDDFKLLNDTYGHAAGDEVLVILAGIMNDSARESDLIARYGGEEFVILMPNTDLAGAVHLAEKIRMAVESTRLIIGDTMKPVNTTISLGVAVFTGNRREFFTEADKALYQAKAAGKNCVIIAGSETTGII
jgi:diguanylate cyclase (GGDEF)-like protein